MRSKTDYPPTIVQEKNPPIGPLIGTERASPGRREFMKSLAAAAGGVLTRLGDVLQPATHAELPGVPDSIANSRHAKWVRPLIGTGWHGHTFPGVTAPFGLVQLSPDTSGPPRPWYDWDHSGGYHFRDQVIAGFSHTHVQGTGAGELGDILLMPLARGRNWSWNQGTPGRGYSSLFSHHREVARAGYYAVWLETPQVMAELTATTHCGVHRYSAGTNAPEGVLLDLAHGLGCKAYHAELNFENDATLSGSRFTHGWAPDRQIYFVLEFSLPMLAAAEVMVDGRLASQAAKHASGTEIKARFRFDNAASAALPLLVRLGISGTSIEGARKNLRMEVPDWEFDEVCHRTAAQWEQALSRLDADLPDPALTQVFYTAAWHGLTTPATFTDVDGAWRGQDRQVHKSENAIRYTTISTWDICRSEFPLLTLAQPERINDMIGTLLADYAQLQQGSIPYLPVWNDETWSQTGFHAVGMILGAYVRGFRSFDVQSAYSAMRETALVGATGNGNRVLQKEFRDRGYIATAPHRESVFFTLDFAYDFWCVGAMAQLLGNREDAAYFYGQARNYRNLFDAGTGFMRGRTADGKWREPFRPDEENWADYTESDSWQATFTVMHDVPGLIDLFGGDAPFIAKLDALFSAPPEVRNAPPDITGLIGQDAQGNEPSNHIPYLYAFAGAPWKTQYWVRRVMARWYTNTPSGIPGNDDVGQLSSWFTLGALGLYPVNAANGVYVLGSPTVNRCRVYNQLAGTEFIVVAESNSPRNVYIQDVRLNGVALTRSWLAHGEIVAGGELVFRMGSRPNREWAASPADRPPSGLIQA
jgi:predicted alpha-1,2-mannosidase